MSNSCEYCSPERRVASDTSDSVLYLDDVIDGTTPEVFEELRKLVTRIRPQWLPASIKYQLMPGSATNRLFGLFCEGDPQNEVILFRIHGNQTDLYIDRASELRNTIALHRFGLTSHLFVRFTNGVAYQFLEGQVLNFSLVRDPSISDLIAREFARMHTVPLKYVNANCTFTSENGAFLGYALELFYKSIPEKYNDPAKQARFTSVFGSRSTLRVEVDELLGHISKMKAPVVFCHNDVVMRNIVHQPWASRVRFIDWEYAAPNYAAFDIASHFVSFVGFDNADFSRYPNAGFQRRFLRTYLTECARLRRLAAARQSHVVSETEADVVSEHELDRWFMHVQQFSIYVYLMWILWALVQMHISTLPVDFLDYAVRRFLEYKRVKIERLNGRVAVLDSE